MSQPSPSPDRNLPVLRDLNRLPSAPTVMPALEDGPVAEPLGQYLWVVQRQTWKILAFVAASLCATFLVSSRIQPVYEATATIDVDRQPPSAVIGQEAAGSNFLWDADQFLATQTKLIQSDSVLRPVAQKFQLGPFSPQTSVTPSAVPLDDGTITLSGLRVTRPPSTYLLQISYRATDPRLVATVANAVADSYLNHTYQIRIRASKSLSQFMEKQLEELRARMEGSGEKLSQFERELNVINPEEKTNILSARLLQLNTEYTNAQSDRMKKETAFSSLNGGTMEAAQVSAQGEALRRLFERLNEAQEKFVEIKAHYGANHPEYQRVADKVAELQRQVEETRGNISRRVGVEYQQAKDREEMLRRAVADTKQEFDRVNARSFQYQSLKREAEADKKLYEELERKIKEAGINAGFQNNAVRLADAARPATKPVSPNTPLNLLLAALFSTVLAAGTAIMVESLDRTVRDADQASRLFGADVIGLLPRVHGWRTALPGGSTGKGDLQSSSDSYAPNSYDESVRTLRNAILLADFDRRVRALLITSALPGEGKSSTAYHLALAHASQNKRTLLIDADLRRPSIHKHLGMAMNAGLTDVVTLEQPWRKLVVKHPAEAGLDVLPAGPPSRRASDLIGQVLLPLLEEASRDYDLIIVDAPPLLGFAEPLQMATAVDGVVVVVHAAKTNRRAVISVMQQLKRLRANVLGVVLNRVNPDGSAGGYSYQSYRKYYQAAD